MSMSLVFTQILVILGYVLIGFAAGKIGLINPDQRKYLTRICSGLILPFTILSATSKTVSSTELLNLGIATLMYFLIFGLSMGGSLAFHHFRKSDPGIRAASTSLITFPNCTFLGLPLCTALFGEMAILFNAGALIAFNVMFFSIQCSMFTGQKFRPRSLVTAPNVSTVILIAMLLAGLHFPAPVETVISSTGAMITPLSLIIIGVMMSESQLITILKEKRAYLVMVLRNLLIPFIALLILHFIPIGSQERLCILIYIACPCATLTTIYSIQNNMEPELCARSVLMSTLFFAVTLPVMIAVGQFFLF